MSKVKLSGLWKNKTAKGETYLSGKIGNITIQVMPNSFKTKDSDPDYSVYMLQNQPATATTGILDDTGLDHETVVL